MRRITNLYHKLKWRCQLLKESIENLIHWVPVIWNDRDFDSHFLERMIITKLNRMADHFNHGHHEDARYNASRMRTACKLLTRVHENHYTIEYQDYYYQDFTIRPDGLLEFLDPKSDDLGQYFDKYPKAYKYVMNKYKDRPGHILSRVGIAIRMGHYLESKARRTAYNMISNYSPNWWD